MYKTEFTAKVAMNTNHEDKIIPLSDCETLDCGGSKNHNPMIEIQDYFSWSYPNSLIEVLAEKGCDKGIYFVKGSIEVSRYKDYYGEVDEDIFWENLVIEAKKIGPSAPTSQTQTKNESHPPVFLFDNALLHPLFFDDSASCNPHFAFFSSIIHLLFPAFRLEQPLLTRYHRLI